MKTQLNQREKQRNDKACVAQLIQERAYQRYVERGQEPGHELEDWLKAERDIREREEIQQTE